MSDMGMGNFAETSQTMADLMKKSGLDSRLFSVGEEIAVKGSKFTVEKIDTHELTLRLIPDDVYQQIPKA